MTFPGDSDNWNGRATSWTIQRGLMAEKVEYFVGPVSRMFGQRGRAHKLARTIWYYRQKGWRIVLAGHSNGCDVILKALRQMDWPNVEAIHFFSAACDGDFERTGLNAALRSGRIKTATVYVALNDRALWLASVSHLAKMIGYGTLGRSGPVNLAQDVADRVHVVRREFGHSGWFEAEDGTFDGCMSMITGKLI